MNNPQHFQPLKGFLCHSHRDSAYVIEVAKLLMRSLDDIYIYEEDQVCNEPYFKTINENLANSGIFIVFLSSDKLSTIQHDEISRLYNLHANKKDRNIISVLLNGLEKTPDAVGILNNYMIIKSAESTLEDAYRVAKEICERLKIQWKAVDGLPSNPHLFSYEKDILQYFAHKVEVEQRLQELCSQMELPAIEESEKAQLGRESNDLREEYQQIRQSQLDGCPAKWPEVVRWKENEYENQIPQDVIGAYRPTNAMVVAAGLSSSNISANYSFPEAGPRARLVFPHRNQNVFNGLRVAIIVSGGIAPGINAVIDGITQRQYMYAKKHEYPIDVFGIRFGFGGFENLDESIHRLKPDSDRPSDVIETSSHANEGGSILETSRYEDLANVVNRPEKLELIVRQLLQWKIDILYVIGGDGSMRAAHAIWKYAQEFTSAGRARRKLSVVAIPKTMDNDILWVWQTFGFLSAVARAMEVIENLATEVKSNPRLLVLQLFGSDSGFVVSHAVLASRTRVCDVALIPEVNFKMENLAKYLKKRMWEKGHLNPYGYVVMAETAIPIDAMEYIDVKEIGLNDEEKEAVCSFDKMRKLHKRIEGQTNDALRTAGLKIVSKGLKKLLPEVNVEGLTDQPDWKKVRVFTNEPRHLLRSTPPSPGSR